VTRPRLLVTAAAAAVAVYIAGDALSALRYDGYSYADQAMMILSAVAFPGWFRRYAPATTAVVVGFERINAYAYFAWLVLLG